MLRKSVHKRITRRQFLLGASTALASLFIPLGISSRAAIVPQLTGTRRSSGGPKGSLTVDHNAVDQC